MKKRILFTSLVVTLGIVGTSHLYLQERTSKSYTERQANEASEPFSPNEWRLNANGEYNPFDRIEVTQKLAHRASRATPIGMNFVFRGPDNVGGRTRAMLELFGQPETLLAGSVTGGLFISYNAGAWWQPHPQFQNQDMSSSIVTSLAQDTNSGTIYLGTGSSYDAGGNNGINIPGYGMYKSEDGGATFTHIESTTPENRLGFGTTWTAINRIAVGPDGSVYAATESGMWATHDDGETWENPIYADPDFTIPQPGTCSDVYVTSSGKVVAAFNSGRIYISEDGADKTFMTPAESGLPTGGIRRSCLTVYPGDEDIMYVAYTASGDQSLHSIYKSEDGGATWDLLLQPHDDFSPYCSAAQCQGDYDAAIAVSHNDPNTIFIGGVEIWRYDGSLSRVATEGGAPPASDVLPFYVHADKHYIYVSPNDPNRIYVNTDGGITHTINNGETWQGMNKGYSSTQFYGVAFAPQGGVLLGGTQDNGSLAILNDNENDPFYAVQAQGGDGFDAEISQASGLYFATSQYGVLARGENGLQAAALFQEQPDRSSPFWTVIRLWENTDDPTSKDSIIFDNDSIEQSIAVSNGAVKSYQETITPLQEAAKVIPNSIRVYSGDQSFNNRAQADSLVGDGSGSVVFEPDGSFTVQANFLNAPSENSNVFVRYAVRYDANDVLSIESENLRANFSSFFFEHRLENDLNPGDKITIQDPVQSMVAKTISGGIGIYRGALDTREVPEIIPIRGVGGGVNAVEFTPNGNVAYIASGSALYRVRGLNELYTLEDAARLYGVNADSSGLVRNIFSATGGQITGISIDPTDHSRIVITVSGYGNDRNIIELTDVYSGSGTPVVRNLHGDLPLIPVYDAQIDRNDPNVILIGTEFGVWATSDASADEVAWTDENNDLTYVPVFDVRQQRLKFEDASNSGVYYLGTYGRGIWESSSLVGLPEYSSLEQDDASISSFKVFPNPISDQGIIEFETNYTGNAAVRIYDLNGRMVKSWEHRTSVGLNRADFNASLMRSGSYFVTLDVNGRTESSKFIVLK